MTRAFWCAVVLVHIAGCAHFCGDTGRREGAWGIVFHCQSGATRAAPVQSRAPGHAHVKNV
jgi:hypothetical protein